MQPRKYWRTWSSFGKLNVMRHTGRCNGEAIQKRVIRLGTGKLVFPQAYIVCGPQEGILEFSRRFSGNA